MNNMKIIKAAIFDLDGVITDSATYHYQAWKILSDNYGFEFNQEINELLKGVSRMNSLEIILNHNYVFNQYSSSDKEKMCTEKNMVYVDLIKKINKNDILPGIENFLGELKKNNIKIALASASKNALTIINRLELTDKFDYISDANLISKPKPDPEIFLDCVKNLNVDAKNCVAFEDADAGIQAIKNAKIFAVGINVVKQSSNSLAPDLQLQSTSELSLDKITKAFLEVE